MIRVPCLTVRSRGRRALFLALLVPLLPLLSWLPAPVALADTAVTGRQLLILREGIDAVFGSYVFAVQNTGDKPERFKTPVMLPKEMDDFAPQEGLEASEVSLAPGGGVLIDKEFPPGVQIISLGFRIPARYGHGQMTLTPVSEIQSLTLLLPKSGQLSIESASFKDGDAANSPDPQYTPLVNTAPLTPGHAVSIDVGGLPEGRGRIWILGGCVAGVMVLLAGVFAWRTRPKLTEDAGGAVLVG